MRIIGGTLKGRSVIPPKGFTARPTTDFAREALFNMLTVSTDLESVTVLDLFGGSGSISLEFISRGVPKVTCVEMNKQNASFIRSAASVLGVSDRLQVVHCNVFDFLPLCELQYDIVFADPPYALDGLENIPQKVFDSGIVAPDGMFILEHPDGFDFSGHIFFKKMKKYSKVHFTFFGN